MFRRWGNPYPPEPEAFLAKGRKTMVDRGLAKDLGSRAPDYPWDALGEGNYVGNYLDDTGAHFYRDGSGLRLIALDGPEFGCDTIILSAVSRHPARLVSRDFRKLRTDCGIGIGDTESRVRERAGKPSEHNRFGEYQIFWYLARPHSFIEPVLRRRYSAGEDAAYALRKGKVVEIWLYQWDTQPVD
jgi:hypothetical protein